MARPSEYTKEKGDLICSQLAEGISLRTVCLADDMPDKTTVFNWMRTYPEFLAQYARAKDESADALFEETIDIADNKGEDYITTENGLRTPNHANVQRDRLRVDTRKWMMSKMKPKKYGDKVDVTSGGEKIKGNTIVFTDFTDETTSQSSI